MKKMLSLLKLCTAVLTVYALFSAMESFAQSMPSADTLPSTETIEVIVIEGGKYNNTPAQAEAEAGTRAERKARKKNKGNTAVEEPKSNVTTVEIRWIEIPMEQAAPVQREIRTFDFMGDSFPEDPDDFYNPAYRPEFLKKKKKSGPRETSFTFMGEQYPEMPADDSLLKA